MRAREDSRVLWSQWATEELSFFTGKPFHLDVMMASSFRTAPLDGIVQTQLRS